MGQIAFVDYDKKDDYAHMNKPEITNAEVIIKALSDHESGAYLISDDAIKDLARENGKRPAYVSWYVPDEFVKNLTGGHLRVDHYFMLCVPASFVDKVLKEKDNAGINESGEAKELAPTATEE